MLCRSMNSKGAKKMRWCIGALLSPPRSTLRVERVDIQREGVGLNIAYCHDVIKQFFEMGHLFRDKKKNADGTHILGQREYNVGHSRVRLHLIFNT